MQAAGVDAGRPKRTSERVSSGRRSCPMRTTSVPGPVASACHRTRLAGSSGSRCPVTMQTSWVKPRAVTGMPAYAGAARADEIPGTTWKAMPSATSASASSDPRPKTNGSPPLRRTTRRPACACPTSWALISSWRGAVPVQLVLPTSTSSASGRQCRRTSGCTSRSTSTTSAWASSSAPRRVSSPGSPGPAPTSATVPALIRHLRGPRGARAPASAGQTSTHSPQEVHRSSRTRRGTPTTIACSGQVSRQAPQAVQSAVTT
jgi:hypothetical protein